MPAREVKSYVLEIRMVEARPHEQEQVSMMPRLTLQEGRPGTVEVHDGLAYMLTANETPEELGMDHGLEAMVTSLDGNWVRLELGLQQERLTKASQNGFVVEGETFRAVRRIKLGKKVKLPWAGQRTSGGKAWLEVTVNQGPTEKVTEKVVYQNVTEAQVPPPPPNMPYCVVPNAPMPAVCCMQALPTPSAAPMMPCCTLPNPTMPSVAGPYCQPEMVAASAAQPVPMPAPCLVPCGATMPITPPMAGTAIRFVKESGSPRLEIQNGSVAGLSCEALSLKVPGCGPLQVVAGSSQVALSCPCLKACADRVVLDQPNHVVLEGHVRIEYKHKGQHADVVADRVAVGLNDGRLEIQSSRHDD
jgi:hypothetical protein